MAPSVLRRSLAAVLLLCLHLATVTCATTPAIPASPGTGSTKSQPAAQPPASAAPTSAPAAPAAAAPTTAPAAAAGPAGATGKKEGGTVTVGLWQEPESLVRYVGSGSFSERVVLLTLHEP